MFPNEYFFNIFFDRYFEPGSNWNIITLAESLLPNLRYYRFVYSDDSVYNHTIDDIEEDDSYYYIYIKEKFAEDKYLKRVEIYDYTQTSKLFEAILPEIYLKADTTITFNLNIRKI